MFPALFAASPAQYFFGILLFVSSTFLVLLVMVQRGRGGGLAGAFGGMGGQSAFGTKAGDLFTRITIGVAAVWLLLCISTIVVLNRQTTNPLGTPDDTPSTLVSPEKDQGSDEGADSKATDGEPGSSAAGSSQMESGSGSESPAAGTSAAESSGSGSSDSGPSDSGPSDSGTGGSGTGDAGAGDGKSP